MIKFDGYDEAILGFTFVETEDGDSGMVMVYSVEKILDILKVRDGMDHEGALEFFEFYVEGAYLGPETPVLVWPVDVWDDELWNE
jgi:hypothetical protein